MQMLADAERVRLTAQERVGIAEHAVTAAYIHRRGPDRETRRPRLLQGHPDSHEVGFDTAHYRAGQKQRPVGYGHTIILIATVDRYAATAAHTDTMRETTRVRWDR